ncbi:FUSC family protein [Guptibacillus algicola]|uniref:FUSC family protein n=1 Tax=Guptibacillus algicola TaxID=225844 RepID=UPI001CD3FD91|nr:FUSC family protein [Alkalihalobacillus algicola]MCA0985899.1 FUSC family protein [Alkalihalobacillus algicola]
MKKTITNHSLLHSIIRLTPADPGKTRYNQALRITISVLSSSLTMLVVAGTLSGSYPASILAGVVSLVTLFLVNDETENQQKMSTLTLVVSSATALTISSYLSALPFAIDSLFLIVIFLAYYLQQFRFRYFAMFTVAFLSIYFSTLLQLQVVDLPWYLLGIVVGGGYSYLYRFYIIKNRPKSELIKSVRSFHTQTNMTLDLILEAIGSPDTSHSVTSLLRKDIKKINAYSQEISSTLNNTEPEDIWPGIDEEQLRFYIFDAEMLIQSLYYVIERVKDLHVLEHSTIRILLYKVVESIRDAEVLRTHDVVGNLKKTESVINELSSMINTMQRNKEVDKDWLWLIRRIEAISNHLVESSRQLGVRRDINLDLNDETQTENDPPQPLEKDTIATRKAFQAIAAGFVSIVVGYFLSPTHQYWVLLSTFIVLLGTDTVGMTFQKATERSIGTIFGAIAGFGVALALSGHPILELITLFCCVFLAFYLMPISYGIMMFWMTTLIAIMYDFIMGGITSELILSRVVDTLVGAAIGSLAAALIYPRKTKEKVAGTANEFLEQLRKYVSDYIQSYTDPNSHFQFVNKAFELDEKFQSVLVDAKPLRNRVSIAQKSNIEQWITVITAINYYAKHLLASSNRNRTVHSIPELEKELYKTYHIINYNIEALAKGLKGNTKTIMYSLDPIREKIEKMDAGKLEEKRELKSRINDLYYVWKINESLLLLSKSFGIEEANEKM